MAAQGRARHCWMPLAQPVLRQGIQSSHGRRSCVGPQIQPLSIQNLPPFFGPQIQLLSIQYFPLFFGPQIHPSCIQNLPDISGP